MSAQAHGTQVFKQLANLYQRMEAAYDTSASAAGLTCRDCSSNCCTSYFQHHTHVEWIYLLKGVRALPVARQKTLLARSRAYCDHVQDRLALGQVPSAMCPVNEEGRCSLYSHRLMICRMHGTRNSVLLPNGKEQIFAGCARYVETTKDCAEELPTLDRTLFYKELAGLEMALLQRVGRPLPRVDMTIAAMIVTGPPPLR